MFETGNNKEKHFNISADLGNVIGGKILHYKRYENNTVYDYSDNVSLFGCYKCNNITIKNLVLEKNSH